MGKFNLVNCYGELLPPVLRSAELLKSLEWILLVLEIIALHVIYFNLRR